MSELKPNKEGYINPDGFKIYYEYFGNGDKEAIVLLNGVAMFTKSWYNFLPLIYPEYDILLFDYLGQGSSSSDDVPYEIPRFCDYLTMILDELKIDKIHVMGISFGAIVGAEYARLHQKRIITLTLSGGLITREEIFLYGGEVGKKILADGHYDIWSDSIYAQIFGEEFMKKMRPLFDTMKQKLLERYADRMHALLRLVDTQLEYFKDEKICEERLVTFKKISVPTLIISGRHDRAVPLWLQEKMAEIIPGSRLIIVENCGHVVYIEQAPFFFDTLKKFVKAKSVNF